MSFLRFLNMVNPLEAAWVEAVMAEEARRTRPRTGGEAARPQFRTRCLTDEAIAEFAQRMPQCVLNSVFNFGRCS